MFVTINIAFPSKKFLGYDISLPFLGQMTWGESWEVIEQKKWLVNRIEVSLENMIKDLETHRQTFNSYVGRVDIEFKEWRNTIFAVVAIIISVILGLSRDQLGNSYLYIITVVIGGIVAFFILSRVRLKAYSIVQNVDVSYLYAVEKLNGTFGRFNGATVNLQGMEIDRLKFFDDYIVFASAAADLEPLDAFTQAYKSVLLRSLRSRVRLSVDSYKNRWILELGFINYMNRIFIVTNRISWF